MPKYDESSMRDALGAWENPRMLGVKMTPEQFPSNRKDALMNPSDLTKSGTEHGHQMALMAWCAAEAARWPELRLLFAIPNQRAGKVAGAFFKAEGVKAGLPDLMLPVARKTWHGLFLELKRPGGVPTREQMNWIDKLLKQGYAARVCYGWIEARDTIIEYLENGK
jgi:hypothetical protein